MWITDVCVCDSVCVLTGCLQAEIFSDLVVVTWMSEVKDAVTGEVHLENKNTRYNK